ncbi:putative Ent-kaurene oxidase [Cadophora sp. MPI-SDFR-AT-0126]|nr:putative Ent-kaurene oxidase [Leotiomycetes sp. MPI-SDFR-AT-0126]
MSTNPLELYEEPALSFQMIGIFLVAFLIITVSHNIYERLFSRRSLPRSLPWIGVDDGLFSRARSTVRTFFHTRDLVLEGYEKYSKKNLPFVLPNVTTGPEVILPMSQMEWLLHQPDNILSQSEVNRQFLQADYTMLHPRVVTDTVHEDVIRKELTKLLGDYTEDVQDEIDFAFRKVWGVNTTDWIEVPAYHTMLDVIGRISNRVLVGRPLCRDEEYLKPSKEFARLVVVQGTFISLFPPIFKPLVAPLINFLDTQRYRKCAKYIIPLIKLRNSGPIGDEKKKNDYVQWCIDHSHRKNDPSERTPDIISRRLNVVGFAAIQSSAITLTNLILDLGASPEITTYLSIIRNEVLAELAAERGIWSKSALARMVTLDSTLRESLRMWGFVSRGVLKEVSKKDGVTLPTGEHLPRGTKVGIHAYPVHHDEAFYKDPYTFNPMRSCTQGEKLLDGPAYSGKNKGTALVTTSSLFMPFSHGRHACPGRFFASQQLKLVLAYIALNYDIQPITARPPNDWFVGSQGPPLDVRVCIRRRPGTV